MKSQKECPTCGLDRMPMGKNRKVIYLCPICDENEMKLMARDALRRNKRNIELGLIKSGKLGR